MRLPLTEDGVFPPNSTTLFLLNKETNKNQKVSHKTEIFVEIAVRFFTLFMCGDGGIRTRDLQRDKLAS